MAIYPLTLQKSEGKDQADAKHTNLCRIAPHHTTIRLCSDRMTRFCPPGRNTYRFKPPSSCFPEFHEEQSSKGVTSVTSQVGFTSDSALEIGLIAHPPGTHWFA